MPFGAAEPAATSAHSASDVQLLAASVSTSPVATHPAEGAWHFDRRALRASSGISAACCAACTAAADAFVLLMLAPCCANGCSGPLAGLSALLLADQRAMLLFAFVSAIRRLLAPCHLWRISPSPPPSGSIGCRFRHAADAQLPAAAAVSDRLFAVPFIHLGVPLLLVVWLAFIQRISCAG